MSSFFWEGFWRRNVQCSVILMPTGTYRCPSKRKNVKVKVAYAQWAKGFGAGYEYLKFIGVWGGTRQEPKKMMRALLDESKGLSTLYPISSNGWKWSPRKENMDRGGFWQPQSSGSETCWAQSGSLCLDVQPGEIFLLYICLVAALWTHIWDGQARNPQHWGLSSSWERGRDGGVNIQHYKGSTEQGLLFPCHPQDAAKFATRYSVCEIKRDSEIWSWGWCKSQHGTPRPRRTLSSALIAV